MFARLFRSFSIALSVAAMAGGDSLAWGAPSITSIAPRGLQIGQPTTLVITGADLSADCQVICEASVAQQKIQAGAKANRVEVEVTLDPATAPGLYTLRLASPTGISSPVMIGVDRLPQRAFEASLSELPVALSGVAGPALVLGTKLTGKQGQRLVLDVEAQRLGSGLKPVVRLYDPNGRQIAWSPPRAIIGGDARLETVLPADAEYTIELHDELFRPTGTGFFRLKIGDLQYADLAMPLGASAGSKSSVLFASANVTQPAELDASTAQVPGEVAAPLPAVEWFTGARPRVAISDFAEVVEASRADGSKAQELDTAPSGVSGTLAMPGEEDVYAIAVMPKQKLRLDVVARQFGSPLDGVLTIRKENGEQLASGDDRPGSSDPLVDYTVPAGVNKIHVALKDLLGRGGSEFVYRIVVRDQSKPEFALSLATDKIEVPAGGTQVIPVQVTRTNYNGPIELALSDQPSEISILGNSIPPGATIGLLTLSADNVSPLARLTRLVGRAAEAEVPVLRAATTSDVPGADYQPRIRTQLGLAIAKQSPIGLTWVPGENDQLFLGGKMSARVQFTRTAGTPGKIRLKLLTSQPVPKKTVKQGMQDRVVDDLDRTLRLEGDATFSSDQSDATVNVLVPGDLPKQPWDLVLVAELLSADGKNVVSSLASPVRTLSPVAPFTLAVSGNSPWEGKAGTGETGKLTGQITRVPGYTQPVVVTLDSLPKGYSAPQVLVPGDKSQFELPLTFAFSSKPGELKGAKLVAIVAPVVATSVRSNLVDVAINIVPGEKPVTEQPKEIYEDDEKFIALFTEGNGRAIPDQRDQYSGKYSLRVTPDQKFNANLPNFAVKIRENPGPGEYRYVRFAWKKVQGNSICLQLAHGGKFGPASDAGGREGAKFRYHAGPSGECFGASLQVSDKIPAQFQVVTRDLFIDFGEFTLTGLGFSPVDGQSALYDHFYLARQLDDFDLLKVEK
jgi:hypothetical protein